MMAWWARNGGLLPPAEGTPHDLRADRREFDNRVAVSDRALAAREARQDW